MVVIVAQPMNVFNTTELHIYKWLRWQILCYIYFTTILKIGEKNKTKYTEKIKIYLGVLKETR